MNHNRCRSDCFPPPPLLLVSQSRPSATWMGSRRSLLDSTEGEGEGEGEGEEEGT